MGKSNGRRVIPIAAGLALTAAAGADGCDLLSSAREDDWLLFAQVEMELWGGLWLLSGVLPRPARAAALAAACGLLLWDLAQAVAGRHSRLAFGGAAAPTWLLLCGDVVAVCLLIRWRPAPNQSEGVGLGLPWTIAAAAAAVAAGVAFDRLQIGRYPIVATTRTAGSLASGLDYLTYLPDGYYASVGRWPLILVLHGSGQVGRDVERVRIGGLPRRLERDGHVPFAVVAPQCPKPGWDVDALDHLLDEVLDKWRIDADRVYLTGESMGGCGVWELAAARPDRFAAAAPICGWGEPDWAERLAKLPIRAFHGDEDDVVPLERSREMVEAARRAGGEAELTIHPGVGHDSWTQTYETQDLYEWFLAHRRRTQ